jgi:hypothetical protein
MKSMKSLDWVVWNENTGEMWTNKEGKVIVFGHECHSEDWAEECTREHLMEGEWVVRIGDLANEDVMAIVSIVQQGWKRVEEE